jgi:crossover junction endodeoxyribonuclease RuvC
MSKKSIIILGLDPGTKRIGYGLIKKEKGKLEYLQSGLVKKVFSDKKDKHLLEIEKGLIKIIKKTKPNLVGIEKLYFSKNKKTAIEVAQVRGIMLAVLAKLKIPFIEISPTQAKLASTGNGKASKKEVAKMVYLSLGLDRNSKKIDDVTDALAIAIAASNKLLSI